MKRVILKNMIRVKHALTYKNTNSQQYAYDFHNYKMIYGGEGHGINEIVNKGQVFN